MPSSDSRDKPSLTSAGSPGKPASQERSIDSAYLSRSNGTSARRKSLQLFEDVNTTRTTYGSFFGSEKQREEMVFRETLDPLRKAGYSLLTSRVFEHVMAVAVCCNFVVVIIETDSGAKEEKIPAWVEALSWSLLITFVLEILLALYTLRGRFHHDKWNVFDVIVIGTDFIMSVIGLFTDELMNISQLRILRLTRIARAAKLIQAFPELRLMLAGLIGAVNAIFWGSVLLILVVIMWSVIAVQFIQPLSLEVFQDGFDKEIGCERCLRAYESTFQATLTFWTQIVAGDSWGRETVPIIEKYPLTAVYFSGVYLSVGLAVLNLILGVVVNIATEERERIQQLMIEEKRMDRLGAHDELLEMCEKLFGDGVAELHINDMKIMYESNETFRGLMDRMDIGEEDLDVVWTILDSDKSGTLSKKEFAKQIYKLKDSDTQFLLGYVRYYLSGIKDMMMDGQQEVKEDYKRLLNMNGDGHHRPSYGHSSHSHASVERIVSSASMNGTTQSFTEKHSVKQPLLSCLSRKVNHVGRSASQLLLAPSGSLQALQEQSHRLHGEIEEAIQSGSTETYPDRLADLHNIAWQSIHSIDDMSQQQKVIASLLASQARNLVSVISSLHTGEHTNGEAIDLKTRLWTQLEI